MFQLLLNKFQTFLDSLPISDPGSEKKIARFIFPVDSSFYNNSRNILFSSRNHSFFWNQPKESLFFHSLGRIDFEKVLNFKELFLKKHSFNYLKENIITNQEFPSSFRIPLFIGNSPFSSFKADSIWNEYFNINWFIPKLILLLDNSTSLMVYNFLIKNEKNEIISDFKRHIDTILTPTGTTSMQPGHASIGSRKDLSPSIWKDMVNNALAEIRNDSIEKVVLSRMAEFDVNGELTIEQIDKIAAQYADCVTFYHGNGDSAFFGITPERLLKIKDGIIETESLAGSIKRSASRREDDILAGQLLNSGKNLYEQKLVTDYITGILNEYCENINFNGTPNLKKLENIQHLKTNFSAVLKKDKFFFSLVNSLHPTPAVCGLPKDAAYNFILNNEGYERGLYSGITGWFNENGEGDFAVAIRSALKNGRKLYVFGGCGIVEGSDPDAEYEETEIKMKPIFSIFGYGN